MDKQHTFTLEAEGDERIWRQVNVHLHLYSFDAEGNPCGVASADNGNDRTGTKLSVTTPVRAARIGPSIGFAAAETDPARTARRHGDRHARTPGQPVRRRPADREAVQINPDGQTGEA